MILPAAVVIPALDAGATLERVALGVRRTVPRAAIIIVDDGSRDDTPAVAGRCGDVVVHFPTNRGKGAALRAGITEALARGAEAVVTLDADGQHDPSQVGALLAALRQADIAIGTRTRSGSAMPLRRRLTNALASAAIGALAGAPIEDSQSGFRAMRRVVLERVHPIGDGYEYETDLLIRAVRSGFRVHAVPVPTLYDAEARSHFRGVRDGARVVRTIWSHRRRASP